MTKASGVVGDAVEALTALGCLPDYGVSGN